jgi:predicted XRE-type DNA-binding protein
MGTDSSSAVNRPSMTATSPNPPRDKVMRIATMIKQLLAEVRTHHWRPQALSAYEPSTPPSSVSCSPISPPTYARNCRGSPPDSPDDPQTVLANDSITAQGATGTSTSGDNLTQVTSIDRTLTKAEKAATESARQTLITAITRRITQQRFTAAQAAAVLHLTGPRVTQLLQANVDEFTLDELINLLPALELTIQVVPRPPQ